MREKRELDSNHPDSIVAAQPKRRGEILTTKARQSNRSGHCQVHGNPIVGGLRFPFARFAAFHPVFNGIEVRRLRFELYAIELASIRQTVNLAFL